MSIKTTAQVLLPLSLPKAFSYAVPEGMQVVPGTIVQVPLGNKTVEGVVWAVDNMTQLSDSPTEKPITLKPIIAILEGVTISTPLRQLVDWVAQYTVSAPGNVLKMVLSIPKALYPKKPVKLYRYREIEHSARSTKARGRVKALFTEGNAALLSAEDIRESAQVGQSVVAHMAKEGLLQEEWVAPLPAPRPPANANMPELFGEQIEAAQKLSEPIRKGQYNVTLLDGVTGSGKTEVYVTALQEALRQDAGAQVLILLPEIVLTMQLLGRFRARFGAEPVVWHSSLSPAVREESYRRIVEGSASVIVGARSALFLPYKNLRAIVVDEEHDASYKQEEGVIYQARDMAIVRGHLEQIPVILVSATPSLETMRNVQEGKYSYVHLPSRHGAAIMPKIEVVDMRQYPPQRGDWLSVPLQKALKEHFDNGKQSLLFLNRRGYAPLTLCRNCGYRFQCKTCSSWLVEHRHPPRLMCHHCGHSEAIPKACPQCQQPDKLTSCGPGVERVAEEVKRLLPDANVAIMTSDHMTTANQAEDMVGDITKGNVHVVVGTQMIAKGHHFPHLTLVGIVDADLGLEGGDLRGAERCYQLLHQVSGRAGREKDPGTVVVQSYMPENKVIQAITDGNRDQFIACESASRQGVNMPPFSRLAALIVTSADQNAALGIAKALVRNAPANSPIQVLGPVQAPIFLLRGKYRFRLLVRAPREINIQKWLKQWMGLTRVPSGVKIKVDIDPYSFM